MMRVLMTAMLLGWAMPAEASLLYRFAMTGGTAGVTRAEASIEVADAAARDGLRITATQLDAPQDWAARGLLGLAVTVNGQRVGLADLVQAASPLSMLRWSLDLRSAGGAVPTGSFSYNTGAWDMAWRLDGGASGGRFATDDPAISRACMNSGACVFTGVFAAAIPAPVRGPAAAPVVVPEPLAVAIFGLGLAGLGVAGRRWNLASQRGRRGL